MGDELTRYTLAHLSASCTEWVDPGGRRGAIGGEKGEREKSVYRVEC